MRIGLHQVPLVVDLSLLLHPWHHRAYNLHFPHLALNAASLLHSCPGLCALRLKNGMVEASGKSLGQSQAYSSMSSAMC